MNHQLPRLTLERLTRVFADYPDLAEVRLFGSYATGKATPRSDIDLATVGISESLPAGAAGYGFGRSAHSAEVRCAGLRKDQLRTAAAAYRCLGGYDLSQGG